MGTPIHLWYEFASTYSYLSVMRVDAVASLAGVALQWRPFLLGPIFQAQGWNDSPFNLYPAKGAYMWRDLERLCEEYGLPFERPSAFPRNGLHAARVACAAVSEGWCPEFSGAVYRANFAEDRDIGTPEVLREIVSDLGRDADAALEAAVAPPNKERLRAQTAEAQALGIFGAPSFTVGEELFWGNDRMGAAIAWARGAR